MSFNLIISYASAKRRGAWLSLAQRAVGPVKGASLRKLSRVCYLIPIMSQSDASSLCPPPLPLCRPQQSNSVVMDMAAVP